tara:strand:- start:631 stop:1503 length:873 start_codon:yes stop_codon:yes gene_type:complete
MIKKGIILAGGNATRLKPITNNISKHLLPVYNKPMIYYPLSNLIQGGIRNYMIITNQKDLLFYKNILGNGDKLGLKIEYKIQKKPIGLPHAFILAENFINNEPVCLNLGDHIFFGNQITKSIKNNIENFSKTTIFSIWNKNSKDYGILKFDNNSQPIKIIEKPKINKPGYIVCGLYIYDKNVVEYSKKLKYSKRNELEISDLNNIYIKNKNILVEKIDHIKNNWFDAGSPEKLLLASNKIKKFESKKNYIGLIEWESYKNGFITDKQYFKFIDFYKGNFYSNMLKSKINN